MADIIFLSNARLSFPQLVEPRSATEGGTKKYSADFILSPDSPSFQQFMAEIQKMSIEKWREHAQNVMQMVQSDRKLRCYGLGNEKIDKKTFKPYSGYADMVYVSANKDSMPQMIQTDGKSIDPANTLAYQAMARKMYGGCYVNAAVRPWPQDNKHGRGLRCELMAIQFMADGEAFGEGSADASSMFGAVANPLQGVPTPGGMAGGLGMPSFFG